MKHSGIVYKALQPAFRLNFGIHISQLLKSDTFHSLIPKFYHIREDWIQALCLQDLVSKFSWR